MNSFLFCFIFISSIKASNDTVRRFKPEIYVSDPETRTGATLTAFNKDLYLIMGFDECFDFSVLGCKNIFYSAGEIWKYSVINNAWTKIFVNDTNGIPPSRGFHDAALTDCETAACPSNSIVIHGGVNYQGTFGSVNNIGDFWYYDINANVWNEIIPNNNSIIPPPLSGQGVLTKGDDVYSFAGITNDTFQTTNELYKYSFATNNWTLIEPIDGVKPGTRYIVRMEWINSNRKAFLIYGGSFAFGVGERSLWKYNIENNKWTLLNNGTYAPPAFIHVGTALKNKKFYIISGDDGDNSVECTTNSLSAGQTTRDEVWRYDLEINEWEQLNVTAPKFKRFAFAQVGKKLYIQGGFGYYCDNPGSGIPGGYAIKNTATISWKFA